jgi:hypothetical protein
MQILGDTNATLKDLIRIVEDELMDVPQQLYPLICSEVASADQAYFKIPIQTKVPFPVQFDGEREPESTAVAIVQQYNKATYALTLGFDSDLMRESKAYDFSEKVQEATISAKIFPNYNLTQNIIAGNIPAFDGVNFYSATGHYWPGAPQTAAYLINNTVAASGQTVDALQTDLATALARLRTFRNNGGMLLNPLARYGKGQLLIHCPAALELAFRRVLFQTLGPVTASVTTSGTNAVTGSGLNTLDGLEGIAGLFVDGYLDNNSTTTWYLHYIGMPQRPFVFGESYGITARALGFGTEYESRTNRVEIDLKHRFVEGVYRYDRSIRVA